jgi:hypothetical protein
LPNINGPAFVGEARIMRDHKQPAQPRQRRDNFLHHAVREIVLFRIAAQVGEG